MTYYYVKAGGTATGSAAGYSTPKTGSWSSAFTNVNQYYDNIYYFLYTSSPLNYNDVVLISNAHSKTGVASDDYTVIDAYEGCKFISVSDSDITLPATGASETWTSGNIPLVLNGVYFYGISITCPSIYIYNSVKATGLTIWENCSIFSLLFATHGSSTDYYSMYVFRNCVLSSLTCKQGHILLLGCTVGNGSSTSVFTFLGGTWSYRDPVEVYAVGCNFTNVTAGPLFYNKPQATLDTEFHYYPINCVVDRCSLSSSAWPPNTNWDRFGGTSVVTPISNYLCSNDTGKYFFEEYRHGRIYSTTTVYRSGGAKFRDTSTPYSIYLKTSEFINVTPPYGAQAFRFKLTDLVADFTEYLEFKVEVAQPNSSVLLHGGEVWLELVYPDNTGTNSHYISTKEFKVSGHTAYPYSNSTWIGLSGPVLQTISITTTELGIKGLCSIWMYVVPRLKEFYVCPYIKTVKV